MTGENGGGWHEHDVTRLAESIQFGSSDQKIQISTASR